MEKGVSAMRKIIVGTRQSSLALTQTQQVVDRLSRICAENGLDCEFELRKIVTRGDQILDVTLSKVGGKGLFVKEIEQAMLDSEIDLAVHSLKDMPAELPDGLVIGGVPEREDPRDALISLGSRTLRDLPAGAVVGTSSLRRASQILAARPDLEVKSLRGNIDTRLNKLASEGFDVIVLAAAGLHRMGWGDRIVEYLAPEVCVPTVGQGALAIECRAGDEFVLELLGRLQHAPTALAVSAERSFLRRLNGGCQVPLGAYATLVAEAGAPGAGAGGSAAPELAIAAMVGSPDGRTMLREQMSGSDPEALGREVAERLLARGADKLLAEFGVEA
jgi:hydroxymethylbilane synthase